MSASVQRDLVAVDRDGVSVSYRIEGESIGSGSFATVFLATRLYSTRGGEEAEASDDGEAPTRVALKVAHPPLRAKGLLAQEARLLNELNKNAQEVLRKTQTSVFRVVRLRSGEHPLTTVSEPTSLLIELEHLDGQTLQAWLSNTWRRRLDLTPAQRVDEALTCARELAEALVQIQAAGPEPLIHRDVKPENIMRTSRGLRLFDFNVAKEDSSSAHTSFVGTPGYMAPEVLRGGGYDARADLYSVGSILWQIVIGRPFDHSVGLIEEGGRLKLSWPVAEVLGWPEAERAALDDLLPRLLCDAQHRFADASALLRELDRIDESRKAPVVKPDPTEGLDMIALLSELRPSGLVSVVTDTSGRVPRQDLQDYLRKQMQVDDPLEDWLTQQVELAATRDADRPTLIMLSGNAGDGKSHLLYRLTHQRLQGRPDVLKRVRSIADATHALSPEVTQLKRLATFFQPFADTGATKDSRVHLIAMNTGMVIKFFESPEGRPFGRLFTELERQLGLRRQTPGEASQVPWSVQVVNLDLRDLLAETPRGGASFAERMLDRLNPESENGIPSAKWAACKVCSAFSLCPVAFNLRALQLPTPRRALREMLRRVSLDTEVHLSPRNLWGFLYRLTTGGEERYQREEEGGGACDIVRAKVDQGDGRWLLDGQFTELLFRQPDAGTPWASLAQHDPAYSSARCVDDLHTRLSIEMNLDSSASMIKDLGGDEQGIAGLHLESLLAMVRRDGDDARRIRNDAAVRRKVMFDADTLEGWRLADGGTEFEGVLNAYRAYSAAPQAIGSLSQEVRRHLTALRELVQEVFLKGHGREIGGEHYLRVSQPNARAPSELLVRVIPAELQQLFAVQKVVQPDVHIAAHRGREQLLGHLGYRPTQVTLSVKGVRLTVDLTLYEFLRRVRGGQKPSSRDLARFQALAFVGERVGNALAANKACRELFVWDSRHLHRLALDDFDQPNLSAVR